MKPPSIVIKVIANLSVYYQNWAQARAEKVQAKLLRKIIARYQDTEMGQAFGLNHINSPEQFASEIPVRNADVYKPWWNRALAENPENYVVPGRLRYMAKSSGTTGKSKYIPVPETLLAVYKSFLNHAFFNGFKNARDYTLLQGNMLITSALGVEEHPEVGITAGFGSGLASMNPSKMAEQLVRPTQDIMAITDWDEKVRKTVEQALHLDIRVATGMPMAFLSVLEYLIAYANEQGLAVRTAKDVWPNLKLYAYSGTGIHIYEDKIRRLLGEGVELLEFYSASESPIAYQHRFNQRGLLVDLTTTYYEFIPCDSEESEPSRRLRIHEVELGVPYKIIITTVGGLFAYDIGDRVQFISKNPYVIEFAGRNKEEINLGGEHLRLESIMAVLDEVCAAQKVAIKQFFVGPAKTDELPGSAEAAYLWCVEFETQPRDETEFLAAVDLGLKGQSSPYEYFREGGVLGAPLLHKLTPGTVDHFAENNLVFGQGKLVNLHNERDFINQLLETEQSLKSPASK